MTIKNANQYIKLYEKLGVRSKLELTIQEELKEKGIDFGYETEKLQYTPNPKTRNYTPDILLTKKDGSTLYVEIKGYFKTADRMKHLDVRRCNPGLDIRFVFQNPKTRISKVSKTTYAMWADKNNFRWAAKTIPDEWLNE